MKHRLPHVLQWSIVAFAVTVELVRGVGEFVSLQRWRLSERRVRH